MNPSLLKKLTRSSRFILQLSLALFFIVTPVVTFIDSIETVPVFAEENNGESGNGEQGSASGQDPGPSAESISEKIYNTAITMVSYILETIASAFTRLFLLLVDILTTIITYDAFNVSGGVIDRGWPLVRDAMNMFVILALLAIAIKNLIPGQGDISQTQKQLLSLLVAVVLMNFSRTISLLAVDLSQVVTMTFATAVSEIAAGNFIQMFSIDGMMVIDAAPEEASTGSPAMAILGTIVAKMILVTLACFAIAVMIIAFLVRILLIWILVILAPLAFFAFGLKDVFGKSSEIYSGWMSQFTGMLLFGPTLMFFLWLSMAISAGGDMGSASGFGTPEFKNAGLLDGISASSFMNAIIAIVLLFVGISQSAKIAASTAGIGAILKKGESMAATGLRKSAKIGGAATAIGMTGGAAVAGLGAMGAGAAAVGVGTVGGVGYANRRKIVGGAGRAAGSAVTGMGSLVSKISPALGGAALVKAGGKLSKKSEDYTNKDRVDARKEISSMSDDSKVALLNSGASGYVGQELENMLLTDKSTQKMYKKKNGSGYEAKMQKIINKEDSELLAGISDDKEKEKAKEQIFKTRAGHLHLMRDENGNLDESKIKKIVTDSDFKASMLSEDSFNSEDGAQLAQILEGVTMPESYWDRDEKKYKERTISLRDRIFKEGDKETRDAFSKVSGSLLLQPKANITPEQQKTAQSLKNTGWENVEPADLQSKLRTGQLDISQVPLEKLNAATVKGAAQEIAKKISEAPNFKQAIGSIPEQVFTALGDSISDTVIKSPEIDTADIAKLPDKQRQQVTDYAKSQLGSLVGDDNEGKARQIIAQGGRREDMEFAFTHDGNWTGNGEDQFKIFIDSQPSVAINAPDLAPVQRAIIDQLNDTNSKFHAEINSMVNAARNSSDKAQRKEAEEMVRKLREAYRKSGATAGDDRIANYETALGI